MTFCHTDNTCLNVKEMSMVWRLGLDDYRLAWNIILLPLYPDDVQLVVQCKEGLCLPTLDESKSFPHLGS